MAYNNLLSVNNNFGNPGNYKVSLTVTLNGFGNWQETRMAQQQSQQGHSEYYNSPQQSGLMSTVMPDLYSSSSRYSSFDVANGHFSSSCPQQPQGHLKYYNSSQQSGLTCTMKPDLYSSSSTIWDSAPSGVLPASRFGGKYGQFSSSRHANYDHVKTSTPMSKEGRFSHCGIY